LKRKTKKLVIAGVVVVGAVAVVAIVVNSIKNKAAKSAAIQQQSHNAAIQRTMVHAPVANV
jgi:hypothetical protein